MISEGLWKVYVGRSDVRAYLEAQTFAKDHGVRPLRAVRRGRPVRLQQAVTQVSMETFNTFKANDWQRRTTGTGIATASGRSAGV
jgi:hypothetical protein